MDAADRPEDARDIDRARDAHRSASASSGSDDRPLYGKRRKFFLRAVVFVGLGAMLLPLLGNLYTISATTASDACIRVVAYTQPDAIGATVRFEFLGPGFMGWECYSLGAFGGDQHVVSLGLIPGQVRLPVGTRT